MNPLCFQTSNSLKPTTNTTKPALRWTTVKSVKPSVVTTLIWPSTTRASPLTILTSQSNKLTLKSTTLKTINTVGTTATQKHPCLCNDNHVELFIYTCPDRGSNITGVLHQRDNFKSFSSRFCKSKATKYRTVHGWVTVIHNGKVSQ